MAFRKVNTDFFLFEKKGQFIEGILHEGGDINTVNGPAKWVMVGDKRVLFSSGMGGLETCYGAMVRVTYKGEETNKKNGRKFKAFDIEVDDEWTGEVPTGQVSDAK